ncbi:MAG TPA: hypothetical protein VKO42_01395 [Patescibacteria group bacterium]|nr:hypothetical protein [Patescibacteria group bacterium]
MEYAFTIIEWRDDGVILRDEEGASVKWPRDKIPPDLNTGDTIFFYISPQRSQTAKDILNEVLNTEED